MLIASSTPARWFQQNRGTQGRRSLLVLCEVGLNVCRSIATRWGPDYFERKLRAADTSYAVRRRLSSPASQPLMRFQLAKMRLTTSRPNTVNLQSATSRTQRGCRTDDGAADAIEPMWFVFGRCNAHRSVQHCSRPHASIDATASPSSRCRPTPQERAVHHGRTSSRLTPFATQRRRNVADDRRHRARRRCYVLDFDLDDGLQHGPCF